MAMVLIALTIGTLVSITLRGAPFDKMIASAAITILGVLYVVLLGGHLVAVRTGFEQTLSAAPVVVFFSGADGRGHWRPITLAGRSANTNWRPKSVREKPGKVSRVESSPRLLSPRSRTSGFSGNCL